MIIFLFFYAIFVANAAEVIRSVEVKCMTRRCSREEPAVGYPFWLRDRQPECCGAREIPGFELFCDDKKKTVLRLPNSIVNLSVRHIDYQAHRIDLYDPDHCVLNKLPYLNLSDSAPLRLFNPQSLMEVVMFSRLTDKGLEKNIVPCLSIKVIPAGDQLNTTFLVGYSRISDVTRIPMKLHDNIYDGQLDSEDMDYEIQLSWYHLVCHNQREQGQRCSLNSQINQEETYCNLDSTQQDGTKKRAAVVVLMVVFIAIFAVGIYYLFYHSDKVKGNQEKIERFLENYRNLKPSRFSYADIKRMTNQFKEKLGQGGYARNCVQRQTSQ
ncbi:hypothetical protein SLE2022_287110 [Rubroshorea leprosula]